MKVVNVVAAIICNKYPNPTKIFITQRGYGEFKGLWEFPGGKLEMGETAKEALAREIKEELNAEICVREQIYQLEFDYPAFHLSMQCFACYFTKEQYELKEHLASRWISKEELKQVDWLPADFKLIATLEKLL